MSIKRFGVRAYGNGDIVHAPFVQAGKWVFGTGLRATLESGLMDPAVLRPGRPFDAAPKAQREAAVIFETVDHFLQMAGSAMSQVARLDQYYPDPASVDPYHVARKKALAGQVAPSTSVIVSRLLNGDAAMDVQVLAATRESGYEATRGRAEAQRLNVPSTSGYAPHVRMGDLVFVAGQLARDASGNIAAEAQVPAGQSWSGTRIQLETEYLIKNRLLPALEAAGSALGLVLKAQVYLTRAGDLPAFWQTWSAAFEGRVPPTTVVPVVHPAFGTTAATVEINLVAAHASKANEVRDIECGVPRIASDMLPARLFDGVLFVAGLMAVEDGGLCPSAAVQESAPFFYDSAAAQMADCIGKAEKIFTAAGTHLSQITRALQFHSDLGDFRSCYMAWGEGLRHEGLPFSAVQVAPDLFVPGAKIILDLWGHVPAS